MKNIPLPQFIAKLQQFPADATIQINDADTGGRIYRIHIHYNEQTKTVSLSGNYSEMDDDLDGVPYEEKP